MFISSLTELHQLKMRQGTLLRCVGQPLSLLVLEGIAMDIQVTPIPFWEQVMCRLPLSDKLLAYFR